ncbi:acyl-CoA dehydrogenase family protein [Streptomyces chartreusis]|uniref:acyl-CoA dehydrogenase family protein n=1 Tax=Streptomyces chartreusis TaxID=1969 RepID=UPI0033A8953D
MTTGALDEVVEVAKAHTERVDRDAVFPAEALAALRCSGLMGMFVPEEFGGLGSSLSTYVETAAGLAGACMSTAAIWTMHAFQVDAIARYGTPRLRDDLLPRIAKGDIYLGSVTTEVSSGADMFTADAPLVVDAATAATAHFERSAPVVTGGQHADGFLITLRAGPERLPHEVSLVYADRRQMRLTEHSGSWDPMGMRGTESIGLDIEATVPVTNIVGEPGRFREVGLESMVPLAHLGWSACWLGAARGAYREVLRWLRSPTRRGGPDVRSDLVREQLARIRVDLDLVSAYLTRLCEELDARRDAGMPLSDTVTKLRVNSLKLAASELTFRAADSLVQLAGLNNGYNRSASLPLERCFRDLRSARLNHSNTRLWPTTGALTLLDPSVALL